MVGAGVPRFKSQHVQFKFFKFFKFLNFSVTFYLSLLAFSLLGSNSFHYSISLHFVFTFIVAKLSFLYFFLYLSFLYLFLSDDHFIPLCVCPFSLSLYLYFISDFSVARFWKVSTSIFHFFTGCRRQIREKVFRPILSCCISLQCYHCLFGKKLIKGFRDFWIDKCFKYFDPFQ